MDGVIEPSMVDELALPTEDKLNPSGYVMNINPVAGSAVVVVNDIV
jgi:hypothetical protein